MPRKKPPNWEDIKTRRTISGESWDDIQKVYDVPLSTLKNRASREKWKYEAIQIGTEIRESIKQDLKELCRENIQLHLDFLKKLREADADGKTMLDFIQNPFLFDGERVNSLFQTAMNNATKLTQSVIKVEAEEEGEDVTPGFNVTLDA